MKIDYRTKADRMGKESDKWAVIGFTVLAGFICVLISGVFGPIFG